MFIEIFRDHNGEDGRYLIAFVTPPIELLSDSRAGEQAFWDEVLQKEMHEWMKGIDPFYDTDSAFIDHLEKKGWTSADTPDFEFNMAGE
jgi:hypothetical protein